jgi:hypothetical protein
MMKFLNHYFITLAVIYIPTEDQVFPHATTSSHATGRKYHFLIIFFTITILNIKNRLFHLNA